MKEMTFVQRDILRRYQAGTVDRNTALRWMGLPEDEAEELFGAPIDTRVPEERERIAAQYAETRLPRWTSEGQVIESYPAGVTATPSQRGLIESSFTPARKRAMDPAVAWHLFDAANTVLLALGALALTSGVILANIVGLGAITLASGLWGAAARNRFGGNEEEE